MPEFRRALLPLLAVLALVLSAPDALAEEGEVDLATEIETARKAKDDGGTQTAVKKVPAAYKLAEKGDRGKLVGALGKVLKDKKLSDARHEAVDALVALQDPKPAWKQLSKVMPNPKKTEEADELQLAVVKAAGALAQKGAVKPLIEMASKAKDPNLAAEAAGALGGYREDEKGRVKIFEELMSIALKTRPGQSTTKNVSAAAQERWQKVGPRIVESFIRLTGRKETSFDNWEQLYKDNKKRLKDLFEEDE